MGRFLLRTLAVVALGSFCVGTAAYGQSTPVFGPGHVCVQPIQGAIGPGTATATAGAHIIQPVGIRLLGHGYDSKDPILYTGANTIFVAQGEAGLAVTVALNRTIDVYKHSFDPTGQGQESLSLTNVRTTLPGSVSALSPTSLNSRVGEVRFSIGADMPVIEPSESESEFPTGEYDGSFSVTVNYN